VLKFGIPAGSSLVSARWPSLSPDGRTLVFLGVDSAGARNIWVRPLDALEAHPIPGDDRTPRPFWSPDSRSLAYLTGSKLYRMTLNGGTPVAVGDTPGGADGTWGGNSILYDGSGADSIRGIPAEGGKVFAATRIDRSRGETGHSWPFFLPDGRHFLFCTSVATQQTLDIKLGRLGSLDSRTVGQTDSRAVFAAGYVFYTTGGSLVAQRLDVGSGKTSGEPIPIGAHIAATSAGGDFSVSQGGSVAYRALGASAQSHLVWFDRTGRLLSEAAPPGDYDEARLSPDGRRVALRIKKPTGGVGDIWVRDLTRNVTIAAHLRFVRQGVADMVPRRQPHRLRDEPNRGVPHADSFGQRCGSGGLPHACRRRSGGSDRLVARRKHHRRGENR
jgi:Tol biopolymer transport system component